MRVLMFEHVWSAQWFQESFYRYGLHWQVLPKNLRGQSQHGLHGYPLLVYCPWLSYHNSPSMWTTGKDWLTIPDNSTIYSRRPGEVNLEHCNPCPSSSGSHGSFNLASHLAYVSLLSRERDLCSIKIASSNLCSVNMRFLQMKSLPVHVFVY